MAHYTLNQYWRLFASALGFVIFGVCGVLFKLILLPYQPKHSNPLSAGSLNTQLAARRLVNRSWFWFTQYLIKMRIVEAHFHGFDKLGRRGQLILANHPSLLDVVFILIWVWTAWTHWNWVLPYKNILVFNWIKKIKNCATVSPMSAV